MWYDERNGKNPSGNEPVLTQIKLHKGGKMRRPDLIILVAVWQIFNIFIVAMGIVAMFLFAFPSVSHLYGEARLGAMFGLYTGVAILLAFILLAVMATIGLLAGKEWGRVLGIAHAAVNLISIPFGTGVGILVLIYLFKPEVRDYFEGVEPEQQKPAVSKPKPPKKYREFTVS